MIRNNNDIREKANEVAKEWFNQQVRNPYDAYYLYHKEGDLIVVSSSRDTPEGYYLSSAQRIPTSWTEEHARQWIYDTAQKLPILSLEPIVKELKNDLSKGETVVVPSSFMRALSPTLDTEPSAEVKKWMKKAHNIDDYKGGRSDRRSMLAYLINYYTIGDIRDRHTATEVAFALGKDLGYGTPPSTGISWERYFAEKIANETQKDVWIIQNAVVVNPGGTTAEEKLKIDEKKAVTIAQEGWKKHVAKKEAAKTGDEILDNLLESSENIFRAANKSNMRPHARSYAQAVYNFLLKGGEEPVVPIELKYNSNYSKEINTEWEEHTKKIFAWAVSAAKKTKILPQKTVQAVVKDLNMGKTVTMPESALKEVSGLMKAGTLPAPDFELEKREAERMAKEREREENPDDYYRDAETEGWQLEPDPISKAEIDAELRKEIASGETVTIPEETLKANLEFTPKPVSATTKELAARSHQHTSFDPEKRAEQEISSLVGHIERVYESMRKVATTDAQKAFLNDEMKRYEAGYTDKYNADLAAKGRTFSVMITGGSGFNNRAHEKANNAEEKRYEEMKDWDERAQAAILRELKKLAVEEAGGEYAVMQKKIAHAEKMQEIKKTANAIIRKKTSKEDRIKEIMEKTGFQEKTVLKMFEPDYMGRIGFPAFELTNNNANIHRMKERLKEMEKKDATPSSDIEFSGGTISDNAQDDRVQIHFDSIPSTEIRSKLKAEGWHWSPFNKVWQRKRTDMALYSARRILGVEAQAPKFATPKVEEIKQAVAQGATVVVPETKLKEYQNPAYTESALKSDGLAMLKKEVSAGQTVAIPEQAINQHEGTEVDREQIRNMQKAGRERQIPSEPLTPIPDIEKIMLFRTALSKMNKQELADVASRVTRWGNKIPAMKDELEADYKKYRDLANGKTIIVPEAQLKPQAKYEVQFMKAPLMKWQTEIIEATSTADAFAKIRDKHNLDLRNNEDAIAEQSIRKVSAVPWGKTPAPIHNDVMKNTAYYREFAYDFKEKGNYVQAAEFYKLAIDNYPTPIGEMDNSDLASLKRLYAEMTAPVDKTSKDYKDGFSLGIQGKIAPAVPVWSDQGKAEFYAGYKAGQSIALTKGKELVVREKDINTFIKPKTKAELLRNKPFPYKPLIPKAPLLLTAAPVAPVAQIQKKVASGKTIVVPQSAMDEIEARYKQKGDSQEPPYFRINEKYEETLSKGRTIAVPERSLKPAKKSVSKVKEKTKCKPPVKVHAYTRPCPTKKK